MKKHLRGNKIIMKKSYVAAAASLFILVGSCIGIAVADDMNQTASVQNANVVSNAYSQNMSAHNAYGYPACSGAPNCSCSADQCPNGKQVVCCAKQSNGTCHAACASH